MSQVFTMTMAKMVFIPIICDCDCDVAIAFAVAIAVCERSLASWIVALLEKTEVQQGADIFRLHRHGPVENVFPTKMATLDMPGAKLRSTCLTLKYDTSV